MHSNFVGPLVLDNSLEYLPVITNSLPRGVSQIYVNYSSHPSYSSYSSGRLGYSPTVHVPINYRDYTFLGSNNLIRDINVSVEAPKMKPKKEYPAEGHWLENGTVIDPPPEPEPEDEDDPESDHENSPKPKPETPSGPDSGSHEHPTSTEEHNEEDPNQKSGNTSLSSGSIAGIVIGVLVLIAAIAGISAFVVLKKRYNDREESENDAINANAKNRDGIEV